MNQNLSLSDNKNEGKGRGTTLPKVRDLVGDGM